MHQILRASQSLPELPFNLSVLSVRIFWIYFVQIRINEPNLSFDFGVWTIIDLFGASEIKISPFNGSWSFFGPVPKVNTNGDERRWCSTRFYFLEVTNLEKKGNTVFEPTKLIMATQLSRFTQNSKKSHFEEFFYFLKNLFFKLQLRIMWKKRKFTCLEIFRGSCI